MKTSLTLELNQTQQLVMTPQLQQAIKLLQLSNLELSAYVDRALEQNPLLIRADSLEDPAPVRGEDADSAPAGPSAASDAATALDGEPAFTSDTVESGTGDRGDDAPATRAGAAPLPGEAGGWSGIGASTGVTLDDTAGLDLESRLAAAPSLRAHLLGQVGQLRAEPALRDLAEALVEELDESGYLRTEEAELSARLGCDADALAAALALVQSCEPCGVGARDLAECLALQLAERDRLDPAMRRLLDNLGLLGRGELDRLRACCQVDPEDFSGMLAELRALDPHPGARFIEHRAETLIPDLFLRRDNYGAWQLELNADTLPRILIDRRYAAELAAGGSETRSYLTECRENANWLMRSLDQRARTILKVATEIVRQQEAFFILGAGHLKPLSLRMVAEAVGIHESTTSRVTANKYIATERGIFELKYFFSNAVGGRAGSSAEAVRDRVRRLIANEAPDAVLSDDGIVSILQKDGIDVARRTVAKYRRSMNIPSSVERRRRNALRASS